MKTSRLIGVLAVGTLLVSCATAPREPEPTIAVDLTERDIETVIADAMILNGDSADLVMDLETAHAQPEKYPVTRLEMELWNLEDDIVPAHVNGYIVVNRYNVNVAAVVRALQIGN